MTEIYVVHKETAQSYFSLEHDRMTYEHGMTFMFACDDVFIAKQLIWKYILSCHFIEDKNLCNFQNFLKDKEIMGLKYKIPRINDRDVDLHFTIRKTEIVQNENFCDVIKGIEL